MNIQKEIYKHLPNPSDIEEMIGEVEHWTNPSQGTGFFANKMSAMLSDCLDKFEAIKQIVDSLELSQEDNQ